jgi:threonine/homoserine/homoserine lactone efflux protein
MNAAMINTQLLLSFSLTAAVILILPGPSVMFIVSRALTVGRPAAIATAAGNTLGNSLQGVLAAFGLGALISESALFYNVITFSGALYLVCMGATTLRDRGFSAVADGSTAENSRTRNARKGFLVGVTNPKTIVFFGAALPQFVDPTRGHVVVQMLVLLCVYTVISLFTDTSWGYLGGSIRNWSATSPRRIERLIGGGGICIIGLGIALALSQRVG